VVPTGSADISGPPGDRLADHVSQVTVLGCACPSRCGRGQSGAGVHDLHARAGHGGVAVAQPVDQPAQCGGATTSTSGMKAAAAAFSTGAITRLKPAAAAAAADGSTPGTARILPLRPSSPSNMVPARLSLGSTSSAHRSAIAMATAKARLSLP
jgi:hypothetical protein